MAHSLYLYSSAGTILSLKILVSVNSAKKFIYVMQGILAHNH